MGKAKTNYDFSGSEMLDCDLCSNFSNIIGQPTYTETPEDYEILIDEYKKSGSSKTFNDWLSSDSSKAKYIKSGSKKSFKDWLNQDSTKNILSSIANVSAAFLAGQNVGKKDVLDNNVDDKKVEKTTNWWLVGGFIFGGIVIGIGGYLLIKNLKK